MLDESIAQGIQQEAPPPAARTLIELSIKRAGGSQPQTQIPYTADNLHRYSIVSSGGWEGNRDDTRVRLSHNVRAHTATLAAVRPVDRLTRGQIHSHALSKSG